jgi:hypothetical protein
MRKVKSVNGFTNTITSELSVDGYQLALVSGRTYQVGVTAQNIAGESLTTSDFIIVGEAPSVPINLTIQTVTPSTSIVFNFLPGEFTGGIPLRGFIVNLDGIDLATTISPDATQATVPITGGLGTISTIKIKAFNDISSSMYSV